MATTKGGLIAAKKEEMQDAADATKSMQKLVRSMLPQIKKALPSVLTGERFGRMVLTAISRTPKLAECTPQSFLGAIMQAAQLGVEPNTPLGQAYLIPYRNHGQLECQFQLGYHGLIDLAYRSGEVLDIDAGDVHENDVFEYERGLSPKLRHVPAPENRGRVILYYAVCRTKAGGHISAVMSVDEIKQHARRYSKSIGSNSSPGETNFDAMAKKTVLKQALKYAPLETEFVRGMASDETIKSLASMAEPGDVLDAPDEMTYDVEAEPIKAGLAFDGWTTTPIQDL